MGLLDSIEKLITEHGSAAILRERIALANDKHAALEKKAASLESENAQLRSLLEVSKSEADALRTELAELKAKLSEGQPGILPVRLEKVREEILVALSQRDGLADQQLAQDVGVGQQVAAFHLQELQSAGMVRCTLRVGQRFTPWHLSHEGRRYLVAHGLVA